MSPSLESLSDRLAQLERKHRRLKISFGGLLLVLLLLGGWTSYRALMAFWQPNVTTQQVLFFDHSPLSFKEAAYTMLGGAVYDKPGENRFWGGIGTKRNYRTGDTDGANLYLFNGKNQRANMMVNERGAFLSLKDSTNAVYLGPGLYNDGQTLLELVSHDGKQGLRLGLNGNQQPIFEVIRDGQTTSLLDPSLAAQTRATTLAQ